jgi:hypothetical protein
VDLSSDTRFQLAADVSYQSFGDEEEGVVLSLNSGYLYGCNTSALAFLESLDGQRTFGQVVGRFANRFAIDSDRARRDLTDLAQRLLEDQLIVASA